jgi:hypothetical protein
LCWVAGRRPGNGGHHLYGRVLTVRHWSRDARRPSEARNQSARRRTTHVPGARDDCHRTLAASRLVDRARRCRRSRAPPTHSRPPHNNSSSSSTRDAVVPDAFRSRRRGPAETVAGNAHRRHSSTPPTSTRQSVSRYRFYPTCSAAFRIIKVTASCEINTGVQMKCFLATVNKVVWFFALVQKFEISRLDLVCTNFLKI